MSTSILSKKLDFRNAEYQFDIRYGKEGLSVSIEQTVFHLDGSKVMADINFPIEVLTHINEIAARVAKLPDKEIARQAKERTVPKDQRAKLIKAYLQGVSIAQLSRIYGYASIEIESALKAAGIAIV